MHTLIDTMKLSVDLDRCAPFTRDAEVDPIGSAGHYHSFVLVEMKLPWPSEITDSEVLTGVKDVIDAAAERDGRAVRVLGIVPRGDSGEDQRRVIHYHRPVDESFSGYEGHELVIEAGAEVETVDAMVSRPTSEEFTPVAGRDVLVCTHGSRDVCCGGDGMRLHRLVGDHFPGVRVWRCSHTGGHRFAPTSITFPDGRFWSTLDDGLFTGVVAKLIHPKDLQMNNRGSSGFDSPFAQAAERELFMRVGWDIQGGTTSVVDEQIQGERGEVTIVHESDTASTTLTVVSELARRYPAMVCGQGADPSGKTFDEYRVVSVAD